MAIELNRRDFVRAAAMVAGAAALTPVYPFVQKHFRTGVLTGAIKG